MEGGQEGPWRRERAPPLRVGREDSAAGKRSVKVASLFTILARHKTTASTRVMNAPNADGDALNRLLIYFGSGSRRKDSALKLRTDKCVCGGKVVSERRRCDLRRSFDERGKETVTFPKFGEKLAEYSRPPPCCLPVVCTSLTKALDLRSPHV